MKHKIIIENRRGDKYEVKGLIEKTDTYETYLCIGAQPENKGKKWVLHKLREAGTAQAYDVPKVDKGEALNTPGKTMSTGKSSHNIAGWNSQKDSNIDERIKTGINLTEGEENDV